VGSHARVTIHSFLRRFSQRRAATGVSNDGIPAHTLHRRAKALGWLCLGLTSGGGILPPLFLAGDTVVFSGNHRTKFREIFWTVGVVIIIEIRRFKNGWQVYERPGVEPVFLNQEQGISYALGRARFRVGEIRVLDSSGNVERIIAFDGSGRML
jgi:hypothetical protein